MVLKDVYEIMSTSISHELVIDQEGQRDWKLLRNLFCMQPIWVWSRALYMIPWTTLVVIPKHRVKSELWALLIVAYKS